MTFREIITQVEEAQRLIVNRELKESDRLFNLSMLLVDVQNGLASMEKREMSRVLNNWPK